MLWSVLHEKAQEEQLPLRILVGELLHIVVLDSIFSLRESTGVALQGGSCLHLVYGGYRYSEDIDLVGKGLHRPLADRLIGRARSAIEKGVVQALGPGQFDWRLPTAESTRRVTTYWFAFTPQGEQQKYRVKIECAQYPAYQIELKPVRSDLDMAARMPLIAALSPAELLAEKITAVAGRRYLKGRDLFDLWYLSEVVGTPIDRDLLRRKFADYGVAASLEGFRQRFARDSASSLRGEMVKFLPARYRRQLDSDDYFAIRRCAEEVMTNVLREER